ncbi:MAG: hypothetical protein AAF202_05395, partial [Pseudomonadota bacterium]
REAEGVEGRDAGGERRQLDAPGGIRGDNGKQPAVGVLGPRQSTSFWRPRKGCCRLGQRQVLNLGHTFGHALESFYGISHGMSVGLGLVFSAHWSYHHGYLNLKDQEIILDFLHEKVGVPKIHQFVKGKRSLTRARLEKLIREDKKVSGPNQLTFIFLEGIGKAFRKTVDIDSFLTESQRQGWSPA